MDANALFRVYMVNHELKNAPHSGLTTMCTYVAHAFISIADEEKVSQKKKSIKKT